MTTHQLTEALVRQCADDVLDELSIRSSPIDPEWIAAEKGLALEERSSFPSDVFGALYRRGDHFGILVSAACPTRGHRRFTIAHELGHYHLDGHVEHLLPADQQLAVSQGGNFRDKKNRYEREADWFASELLMPDRLVRGALPILRANLRSVRKLADSFETSLSSAGIRLTDLLADDPMAMVLSFNGVVEWAAFSAALNEHRWARRSWKGEWVPPRSATHRLMAEPARIHQGDEEGSSLLLCEWFDAAPRVSQAEEEALGLGSYGRILTVLAITNLPGSDELEEHEEHERERDRDWRDALRGYELD